MINAWFEHFSSSAHATPYCIIFRLILREKTENINISRGSQKSRWTRGRYIDIGWWSYPVEYDTDSIISVLPLFRDTETNFVDSPMILGERSWPARAHHSPPAPDSPAPAYPSLVLLYVTYMVLGSTVLIHAFDQRHLDWVIQDIANFSFAGTQTVTIIRFRSSWSTDGHSCRHADKIWHLILKRDEGNICNFCASGGVSSVPLSQPGGPLWKSAFRVSVPQWRPLATPSASLSWHGPQAGVSIH